MYLVKQDAELYVYRGTICIKNNDMYCVAYFWKYTQETVKDPQKTVD